MGLQPRWAREDAGDDEDEEDEGEKRAPKPKRKPQKKKTKKRPTKQKKACENQDKKAGSLYKAGDYKQQRLKYIQRRRDVGWTFREAADAWNESSRKAKLLAGMSKGELKRRRFI